MEESTLCDIDNELYVSNEHTRYISVEQWRKFNMGVPMTDRDPLLVEREKTHGSFKDNAELWEELCKLGHFQALSSTQKLALSMIYLKIARIAGQPLVKDHWDDIAGYAKLGSEACE